MKTTNYCDTIKPNQKGMPSDFGKKLILKQGNIKTRVKGDLTAVVWKDKQNLKTLANMYHPPAKDNFCNEYGNALKAAPVQDSSTHMEYADKRDYMAKNYPISRHT
jgi:hypothetical protein